MTKPDLDDFRRQSIALLQRQRAFERANAAATLQGTRYDKPIVQGGESDYVSRIIWYSETHDAYKEKKEEIEGARASFEAVIDRFDSPLQSEVMRCHYMELMSVKQIANLLNYHPDTIRKALREGKAAYHQDPTPYKQTGECRQMPTNTQL